MAPKRTNSSKRTQHLHQNAAAFIHDCRATLFDIDRKSRSDWPIRTSSLHLRERGILHRQTDQSFKVTGLNAEGYGSDSWTEGRGGSRPLERGARRKRILDQDLCESHRKIGDIKLKEEGGTGQIFPVTRSQDSWMWSSKSSHFGFYEEMATVAKHANWEDFTKTGSACPEFPPGAIIRALVSSAVRHGDSGETARFGRLPPSSR
jgi:hypothetical protein